MNRRTFCGASLCATAAWGWQSNALAGTEPLALEGDLSKMMMDGAHRFAERKIAESLTSRRRYWKWDASSRAAYEESVRPNRERFLRMVGAVDPRLAPGMQRFGDEANPAMVADGGSYRVFQVRWPVLDGVHGEGLLLEPKGAARARAVVLPDADTTPEQAIGLAPGISPENQFGRLLALRGCTVVVPVLVDRTSRWSGHPEIRMTDQPHREWIYRQAFHMGRHIIGFEVEKVLACVDWFQTNPDRLPIGVAGCGEGGLIAFYSAAADTRIDAAVVSGYFDSRQGVWSEPIYRNLWGLLEEFGDAEIATLIAPRRLVVHFGNYPEVTGHKGELKPPPLDRVRAEFSRIGALIPAAFHRSELVESGPVERFAGLLGLTTSANAPAPADLRRGFDPAERQRRQVRELETYVQQLVAGSERVRSKFFLYKALPKAADRTWTTARRIGASPAEPFIEAARSYRELFWKEAMGRFDDPLLPPKARTRVVYDRPRWTGYETVLDVWPDVFAWGILAVPKDLKSGERRPVVVSQHGRNGLPKDAFESDVYYQFAGRLADEGFITFAPHNLYRGEDRYRYLSRKANGIKGSLFSFIIGQHQQLLRWLGTLPFVDPARIAFYGLSYGGETAVRVPTVLEGYCLSICSGDFNSWTRKVASTEEDFGFMYTIEWEMPYFNLGSTFDYAEMAYLMVPRPFMVERGHHDMVSRDQWVAYEYAKVRWLYTQLGLGDRTDIDFFNGGHAINLERSREFLRRHLGR